MVERLLFDRVDAEARAATVGGEDESLVDVLTYETETAIARFEMAFTRAEVANDATIFYVLMPPTAVGETDPLGRVGGRIEHHSCHDGSPSSATRTTTGRLKRTLNRILNEHAESRESLVEKEFAARGARRELVVT